MEACGSANKKMIDIYDYTATLFPEEDISLVAINATPVDQHDMIFHPFNVSHPSRGVQVHFNPHDHQIFSLFGQMHEYPTPDFYLWNATFETNKTENLEVGFYFKQRFVIYLTAGNITNGTLYIGVKRTGEWVWVMSQVLHISC